MESASLTSVCAAAFFVVFGVLCVLAAAMRLITALFPASASRGDPAVIAAVSSSVASRLPGARVTRIEEER